MKLEIKKSEGGDVKVVLTYDAAKKPVVISGQELDGMVAMIQAAKLANSFYMSVEVK